MLTVALQQKQIDNEVLNYISTLEKENQELKTNYQQQTQSLLDFQNKYLALEELYTLMLLKRFGRSAERLMEDPGQVLLFTEEPEQAEQVEKEEEQKETVKSYTRKKAGRKPLNDKLKREVVEIDLPESEKICSHCHQEMTRIGFEPSEILKIIPLQILVQLIKRYKYACKNCEGVDNEDIAPTVKIAPVPPSMIPKSITSPSLLSTIFTYKFERHIPYYRQEKMYEEIGADISRQDMSNWQQQVYQKITPLLELLLKTVKSGPVLQMDETTVQVISDRKSEEEARKDTQKSYMWLARGGPPGKKVTWYEYHPTRAGYNAKEFLEGYSGYLQTDGYTGYDLAVEGRTDIHHVGCFAHARRKFFEASQVDKKSLSAQEGIKYIRKLYDIEDELREVLEKDKDTDKFLRERKEQVEPILEKFKAWLIKRKDEVLPSCLLGKAVNYSLAQWDKMTAYVESPYLTPDNNAAENAIRPFVLGRKNWLFCQSQGGAKSSCGIYTLIETAKQNGIVPFDYLMALFEKAPLAVTQEDWEKLLPWNIFTA